jgi:hypothetical protein
MNIPCPNQISECAPCSEFPFLNTSAETPDFWRCFGHFNQPATSGSFFAPGCFKECVGVVTTSISECETVTQQCAEREAQRCSFDPPVPPGPPNPPLRRTLFENHAQECTVECPDGTETTEFVESGTVLSPWQADADARAAALACKLARQHQLCFVTASPLDSVCINETMSVVFDVAGGESPYTFTLESGSLPPGTELNSLGNLFGNPTASGTYVFEIKVTDTIGSFQVKEFTLRVIGITSPTSLPSGTTGTPYNYQFVATGTSGSEVWSLVSVSLPDGLTLTGSGLLSGTPTTAGTSNFTASVTNGSVTCQKNFSLQIIQAVGLLAYWTFDDYVIDSLILDSTANSFDITYATINGLIVPGKVGNCFQPNNAASLPVNTGNFALLNNAGATGFTMCGWVKLNPADNAGAGQIRAVRWSAPTAFMELEFLNGDMILNADGDAGEFEQIVYPYPQDGDWHFYRAWYDPADQKARLQIDNGLIIDTVALTMAGGNGNQITFAGNAIFTGLTERSLDESGLWIRVLSDSEASQLWNGGVGTTFPSIPP